MFEVKSSKGVENTLYTDNSILRMSKILFGENNEKLAIEKLFLFFKEFERGSNILFLGSGGNSAVKELELKFPNLNFISLDYRYANQVKKNHSKSDNMVAADWFNIPFENESIDGLICMHSFPYWAKGKSEIYRGCSEISRVSKSGAKMLFTGHDNQEFSFKSFKTNRDLFVEYLSKDGWKTKTKVIERSMAGDICFNGVSIKNV